MRALLVVSAVGLGVACGGTTSASAPTDASADGARDAAARDAAASDAAADASLDAAACVTTSTSSLPGVRVEIDPSHCVLTVAEARAGVTFAYDVVVDADVPGVVPRAQDAGQCGAPDGSGLIPFEDLSGGGQRYCLCDVGLCMPPSGAPVTLHRGRYHHTMSWDGTTWTGPSDTGNPHGPPFPPGSYALRVSAVGALATDGGSAFAVAGTLAITLVP